MALVIHTPSGLRAAEVDPGALRVPAAVKADAVLLPGLEELLRTSPTFRAQCARIAAAERLVVMLHLRPDLPRGRFRARSKIRRYSSGLLIVSVDVASGAGQAEWIGHEFEHVLEALEGEDLRALASRQARGVWPSVDGMIETARAFDAGRAVLYESKAIDMSDKFVE